MSQPLSSARVGDTTAADSALTETSALPLAFGSWPSLLSFGMLCALLLVAPLYLSGFWPSSYDYSAQSLLVSLTACACLLMSLRPQTENARTFSRADLSPVAVMLLAFFAWCAVSSLFTVYWHDTLLEMARIGVCLVWFFIARALLRENSGEPDAATTQAAPKNDAESDVEQSYAAVSPRQQALAARCVVVAGAAVLGASLVSLQTLANYFREGYPFSPFYNKNLLANFCAMSLPLALAVTLEAMRRARNATRQGATQQSTTQRGETQRGETQRGAARQNRNGPGGSGRLFVAVAIGGALLSLIIAAGLFASSSKGGFLAALAALLVFALALWRAKSGAVRAAWQAHRAAFVVAAFVLIVGGGAVASKTVVPRLLTARTSDDNSTMFRAYTWRATAQMAVARPLQGWGPGSFPSAYPQFAQTGYTRTAHQLWLQIAAENGVPALLLLLGACGAGVVAGWRALRTANWPVAAGGLGTLVAFATHGLTDAGWGMTSIVLLLFVALALLDTSIDDCAGALWAGRIMQRDTALQSSIVNRQSSMRRPSSIRWSWLGLTLLLAVVGWAHQRAAAGEEARRKAWDFAKSGAPRAALQQAQQAVASDPMGVRMWLLLAQMQEANGENAEASYARAAQLRPASAQAWRQWAEYRVRQIAPGASSAGGASGIASPTPLFDRAVALDPNEPGSRLARGQWRLQQGDARGWSDLEHIARLADAPYGRYPAVLEIVDLDFARADAKLAERALRRGDKKTARTLLARGLKDVARAKGNYADSLAKASAAGMELPEDPAPIEATLNELQTQAR